MLVDDEKALITAAAIVMGVTPEAITGRRKRYAESLARQIVMAIWSDSHSLQHSCEIVGRTHHTAAYYARRAIHERLQYCEATKERVRKILQKYSEIILAQSPENH
jgi:chromosomal replication initiation ATPase DnaA